MNDALHDMLMEARAEVFSLRNKKEPEVTCNNCPESDECPGFDGCFYLAANCPKKKGSKRNG